MSAPDKLVMFENRLLKMHKHYSKLARKQEVSCYRFYDHDLPEFPFAIECYDDVIHAAEYKRRHGMEDDVHEAWLQECRQLIAKVTETDEANIFMKQRQRKAGRQGQYEKFAEEKTERIVKEAGLSFIINLTDYLDTGLFLDHRITRGMVRDEAKGKKVLNLFCYTGSFSLYAASGGAAEVVSVDMSKTYLNWAKRNMQYNKLYDDEKHHFIHADVIEWLNDIPEGYFDLIICDPPTFSNSKRMNDIFDVQRDHVSLLKKLLKGCDEGGRIYFSNNYRGFELDKEKIPTPDIKNINRPHDTIRLPGKAAQELFFNREVALVKGF